MRRKLRGMPRKGSEIDPRYSVLGLSANLFRFRTPADADGGAEGGAGAGAGAGAGDAGAGAGAGDAGKEKTAAELKAELEDARKALKAANSEAADKRKRLEAFEKEKAEKEEAEKSEAQKLKERAEKAEAAAQAAQDAIVQRDINDAIRDAAREAGFIDVSDALQLVDRSAIKLDGGKVTGAADAVKALAKSKAHLVKQETGKKPPPAAPGAGAGQGKAKQSDADRTTVTPAIAPSSRM
jgi:hypothetical protein